jgi:hypothetical protein
METSQSVLFLDSSQGSEYTVSSHCFFSIREATSVAITAGGMQAMTDVSEMAQNLMNSFEDAMAIREGDAARLIRTTSASVGRC